MQQQQQWLMQSSPTPSPLLTHRACNALLCRCTGRHSLAPYTLHTSTAHSTATTSHTADTRPKRSAQQRRRRLRRQIGECTDLRMRRSLPGEGGQRAATESKNIAGRGSVCVLSCPVVVVVTRSQNTAKNQRAAEPAAAAATVAALPAAASIALSPEFQSSPHPQRWERRQWPVAAAPTTTSVSAAVAGKRFQGKAVEALVKEGVTVLTATSRWRPSSSGSRRFAFSGQPSPVPLLHRSSPPPPPPPERVLSFFLSFSLSRFCSQCE